jgi:hypothetical protein
LVGCPRGPSSIACTADTVAAFFFGAPVVV